jgi:hypothetical protein
LDLGHAAAVAITDTALADGLAERKAGLTFESLLALQTKATYTERGRLQRLAQLLRHLPHVRAAWHAGLLGTAQVVAIAAEAKSLRVAQLAELDASFTDPERLARLDPDQLVDLVREQVDRLRPDLTEQRETRAVERSYLHLQPRLDGSGEGRFVYDADAFASIAEAIDHAAGHPTTPTPDRHGHDTDGDGDGRRWRRRGDAVRGLRSAPRPPTRRRLPRHLRGLPPRHRPNRGLLRPRRHRPPHPRRQHHRPLDTTDGTDADETTEAPRPPRWQRRRAGRPRARAVVVLDINHLTGTGPTARGARLLWRMHGSPPSLSTAGIARLCADARLQFLLTDGHTILGITAPTPTIPDRLREAVFARDQGCRFAGCRAPVAWCDLHHVIARTDGGHTVLENLVALCRRHHTAITTGRWTLTMTDDGVVTVRRGRISHTTDPPLHATLAPD